MLEVARSTTAVSARNVQLPDRTAAILGPPAAVLLGMATTKLALRTLTIRRLTNDELGGAVGGLPGGVSNQTGFDTNSVKLTAQWYAAKFTIGKK
jgi:hypothetical protein